MSLGGDKRPIGKDASKDGMPEKKRPRSQLARVIVEAVKMDMLQKLCSSLEPMLRRVVAEEVERALAKLAPPKLGIRSSPKRVQGPDQQGLRLEFRNKLAFPLFTGSKVEGEQGSAIHLVLQHAVTGQVVTTGPEASAKLDIVVLEGDFTAEEEGNWTQEEFENFEVRERDGKRPLLTGDLTVTLKDGVGTLGELTFTDNSSWIRSRKFRLGVKTSSGFCEGLRIREAKTEAFTVKDHRGELYKKHYPPSLNDEVWRLDKIGKDGAFHKRLNQSRIMTVEDFLRLVVMDPQRLRNILGTGMSNKIWEGTVEHAKTCVLSGKLQVYYADEKQNIGVIFNDIFQLMGLTADGSYMSVDSLSDSEKVYVDKLVKVAYENWMNVIEYDGEALIGVKTLHQAKEFDTHTADRFGGGKVSSGGEGESRSGSLSYGPEPIKITPLSFPGSISQLPDNQSITEPILQMNSNIETHNQPVLSKPPESLLLTDHNGLTGLALGHSQSSTAVSSSGVTPFVPAVMNGSTSGTSDWRQQLQQQQEEQQQSRRNFQRQESFGRMLMSDVTEDEIRARSMELLENEDMHTQIQQLLRMYNGQLGDISFSADCPTPGDDTFPFLDPPGTGEETVDEHKPRPNGRAYVSWLKLKAALHWGIFIRKRAAAKRAQLEEADDPDS
ncbi:calmodulin-binding protein 60 D isoform X2 [Physcomitrium patens]|uniref:Calmodulin-binding protein n=1 Tax=Physcomitrium patens TaxID=3218 RepID=A0A2K1L0Y9_PHYPA|nr:calmodulin-binding protein 60 D-like isoform X2 [Physcomitrium patens]PNR59681.1 hypothetical protein PHYPA_002473 [Physcomitrium patens]|eukprot:XP_024365809.1 calmodulin-binding protein 60 D-like isoform X2 [Physcomitrella patens]